MLPTYEQVQDKESSFVHSGERLGEGQDCHSRGQGTSYSGLGVNGKGV